MVNLFRQSVSRWTNALRKLRGNRQAFEPTFLGLEDLENRRVMSVSIHSPDFGFDGYQTLQINGTSASDKVTVHYQSNDPFTIYDDMITVKDNGTVVGSKSIWFEAIVDGYTQKLYNVKFYGNTGNDTFKVVGSLNTPNGRLVKVEAYGQEGSDTLYGSAGTDLLDGGSGNDILYAGGNSGNSDEKDELRGGSGNDWLWGEAGSNSLFGGTGDDFLDAGNSGDYMEGVTARISFTAVPGATSCTATINRRCFQAEMTTNCSGTRATTIFTEVPATIGSMADTVKTRLTAMEITTSRSWAPDLIR